MPSALKIVVIVVDSSPSEKVSLVLPVPSELNELVKVKVKVDDDEAPPEIRAASVSLISRRLSNTKFEFSRLSILIVIIFIRYNTEGIVSRIYNSTPFNLSAKTNISGKELVKAGT